MFSDRIPKILEINRQSAILEKRRAGNYPVLDLITANPTAAGFEYPGGAIASAFSRPELLTYEPNPKGLYTARQAVQQYYLGHTCMVHPDEIILTASTSEAYSYLLKFLANPGDEILAPAPSYPLIDCLAELELVRTTYYPLIYNDGWQIDFDTLEALITPTTRAVLFVNPNNPTGSFLSAHERHQLNRFCFDHSLALIIDEVFLDYPETTPIGSMADNREVLTFVLSGFSKVIGLPQVKLSWIVIQGPEDIKADVISRMEYISDMFLSVSSMVQHAAHSLLGLRSSIQRQIQSRLRVNEALLAQSLHDLPSVSILKRDSGWYGVFRVFDSISEEARACDILEREGIYLHPGSFYRFHGESYFVVSLLTPTSVFEEGLKKLCRCFKS